MIGCAPLELQCEMCVTPFLINSCVSEMLRDTVPSWRCVPYGRAAVLLAWQDGSRCDVTYTEPHVHAAACRERTEC